MKLDDLLTLTSSMERRAYARRVCAKLARVDPEEVSLQDAEYITSLRKEEVWTGAKWSPSNKALLRLYMIDETVFRPLGLLD